MFAAVAMSSTCPGLYCGRVMVNGSADGECGVSGEEGPDVWSIDVIDYWQTAAGRQIVMEDCALELNCSLLWIFYKVCMIPDKQQTIPASGISADTSVDYDTSCLCMHVTI